jgi:hypothetical protein
MPISDKPWGSITEADYPSAAAFCAACLINLNTGPASDWTKGQCKLPVREPGGALNRNAVHAAAGVLAGARGGVDAPPEERRRAARRLLALYRELDEEAPDTVRRLAGGG